MNELTYAAGYAFWTALQWWISICAVLAALYMLVSILLDIRDDIGGGVQIHKPHYRVKIYWRRMVFRPRLLLGLLRMRKRMQ